LEKTLSSAQKKAIPGLILYRLKTGGRTVDDLGTNYDGDGPQLDYRSRPVWHKKGDLDAWIARELNLPPALWGPDRHSNDLMVATVRELVKLRQKGIVADWKSGRQLNLFRLSDPNMDVSRPAMSLKEVRAEPETEYTDDNMRSTFLSIISRSQKDNTYKFALGKTLLDYCIANAPTGRTHEIKYDYLAGEFLKHYWYQKYKFKMRQHFHGKKTPSVIRILEDTFGESSRFKFKDVAQKDLRRARREILDNVFGMATKKKGMVVQRFQRTREGNTTRDSTIFYDFDDRKQKIFLRPEAHGFFRKNYGLLMRALLAEWVRYLERVNHGLPMLAAKLYDEDSERGSLARFRKLFLERSDHCFYCNRLLRTGRIHVDHFIPWSYIFDDNPWNLVLACQECNLGKSSSLPPETFVGELVDRDARYAETWNEMRVSLVRLSARGPWEREIRNHYTLCTEYGFGSWPFSPRLDTGK